MNLKNDLILRAARGENIERYPVWLMRQAGRILPEYRAVRGALSGFKELVETPERAAEVTIQPVDLLGVDAEGVDLITLSSDELEWRPLVNRTKLLAHEERIFRSEVEAIGPITHVKLRIYPDGGVSRLRVYGTKAEEA